MEKFKTFTSSIVPIPLNDIDTDMIIPAQYLTSISRDGYGENLFRRLKDEDPDFAFVQEKYAGAKILVVGDNFGCGSSREHAVWALMGAGIKAIIGKSFADIFKSNSGKNGLLLVELAESTVDKLLQAAMDESLKVTLDLESQTVVLPSEETVEFSYDPFVRHCMLNGIDDLDYILGQQSEIQNFRAEQEKVRFYRTDSPNR